VTNPPRSDALKRAIRLEYVTVGWNVVEVFVTIGIGIASNSLALVAFGLDSLIEIFASTVVLWHLRGEGASAQTRRAMGLVALAFFALAVFLLFAAAQGLVSGREADHSAFGIGYLAITAVVMFTLSWRKRLLGGALENHPLEHEARITFLDGMLATGVLLALIANVAFDAWWADPIAAALVGLAAIPEGIDALGDSRRRDEPPATGLAETR
jgi:divalent metal cation (Fe/Co/Zn/Cd) transporter